MAVKVAVYGTANMKQIERARMELDKLEKQTAKSAGGVKGSFAKMQEGAKSLGISWQTMAATAVGVGVGRRDHTGAVQPLGIR